jgi:hypothetical protein
MDYPLNSVSVFKGLQISEFENEIGNGIHHEAENLC